MANFEYTGRSRNGATVQGKILGPNTEAVVEQLLNRGITPISVKEMRNAAAEGGIELAIFIDWPSIDDLLLFTRQMYTLAKSGVPLVRAFQGLVESTHNKKLVEAMRQIVEDLQGGRDLSGALARHPRIFDHLYVRIVRMGEETGRMEESFNQLYKYMEVDKETRKRIKSALRYPTFVLIAITIAMVIVNYFVIPAFAEMFKGFKTELPLMTRILLNTSHFTQQYIIYIIGAIVAAFYSFNYYVGTPMGKLWWDRQKLRMPLVGSIINRATLARFSRAFAMGSRSGLPTIQILGAVSEAVDNAYVQKRIEEMVVGIERGESMVQAAFTSGMFTPLVMQMMSVGEETGAMDDMMQEVAEFYEREVEYEVANLSSAIEPIMLLVIGAMVLVLALGIFMPMWEMGAAATKK
ncbi:MAG: type II secretion system F family protein [Magnetococcales bacterium]|nr:type II secretion system F family protein [Magnetococcales bacterium]